MCCGGDDLKRFIESAGRNATYTSKDTVIEFVEAICQWVEESLKRLHQAPFYSLMEDECTDISTVEVLSIFCCWIEDGLPVEHFMEIVPLKKADAATIFSTLVDYLKQKTYSLASLWGWGLMEQQPSQGEKTGIQRRLKKNALFVHCHCHRRQLACVQAANHTTGIKHVYTALTTLWKFFHYSPKRAVSEGGKASP